MKHSALNFAIIILFGVILGGCQTMSGDSEGKAGRGQPSNVLRVGVTPDYPPMIFRQGKEFAGVEADLAKQLGAALGRPIQFIHVDWDQQIPALLSGQTDIIMSAMTITPARKVRIDFSDSYFTTGQMVLMRSEDRRRYTSQQAILSSNATVGVNKGTTGDVFVERYMPQNVKIYLPEPRDAPTAPRRREIDFFIYDGPGIAWLVSENEAKLAGFWERLTEENLGWGLRRTDDKLRREVNQVLAQWKKDGILNTILVRWLPYLKVVP